MASDRKFRHLLEPGKIGSVVTKNRIVKVGSQPGFFKYQDGNVSKELFGYYEAIARGGAGLIVVGAGVMEVLPGLPLMGYRVDDDRYIASLNELTQTIHKFNCPVFLQMFMGGPMQPADAPFPPPGAASALTREEHPLQNMALPRALTTGEIQSKIEIFANVAERARKAGFDGIELNAGCFHLLNSFLSRAWNKRTDDYGCSKLENRSRFMVQIIQEIKRRNGKDYAITTLINGVELGLENGITPEESRGIAKILQNAGADAIHVRVECYKKSRNSRQNISTHFPDSAVYPDVPFDVGNLVDFSHYGVGGWVPPAAAIKKSISIPVIAVGRLDPFMGEKLVSRGVVDFIGLNRRLMADHDLPNKLAEGRGKDIAPCTACLTCYDINEHGQPALCQVNSALGKEKEYEIKPAIAKKRVMIVGGGPAGLEAARVAALRGHQVTLHEKTNRLGGSVNLATIIKGWERSNLLSLTDYIELQLKKLGVEIKLGENVDSALIASKKPDVVIIATGGVHQTPDLPGINRSIVITSKDLHRRLKKYLRFFSPQIIRRLTNIWMPVGKRVVIMGGNIQGCQTAEFLVKRGRKVTIVESSQEIGSGLLETQVKPYLLWWLAEKGVTVMTGVQYQEITDRGLTIINKDGKRQNLEADNVVTALPLLPDSELQTNLKNSRIEVYNIGDCSQPRLIMEAIADGSRIGRLI